MAATISSRRLWVIIPGVVLVAALWLAIAAAFVSHGPQGWTIRAYDFLRVRSASMQPTLRAGETIVADMSYYRRHPPRRGDLVIYRPPHSSEELAVKRVLGVAGDRVLVRRGHAIVNGNQADEPYADFGDPDWAFNNTQVFIVPRGHVFLLGDNRANSKDSRVASHGFVAVENLVGRAARIVWTSDLARLGRWVGAAER
jgi:signal peptidase I